MGLRQVSAVAEAPDCAGSGVQVFIYKRGAKCDQECDRKTHSVE